MMKRKFTMLAILCATSLNAQPALQTFHSAMSSAVLAFSAYNPPTVPGAPTGTRYRIGISVTTVDYQASAFTVEVSCFLADGSIYANRALVPITGGPGEPTYVEFNLPAGAAVPTSIRAFWVTRLHAEPNDSFK